MSDIEKVKKLREATGAGFKDCNIAIKEAKGKIITILDHDDWWEQNKLEEQVECFKKNQLDLVFSDFYLFLTLK